MNTNRRITAGARLFVLSLACIQDDPRIGGRNSTLKDPIELRRPEESDHFREVGRFGGVDHFGEADHYGEAK